ncbi:hypothetical protein KUCAC02_031695, partial [Chaenocephalus aceratus]
MDGPGLSLSKLSYSSSEMQFQRGSEELFPSVSSAPYIMSTTANGNDSKKFKGDIRGPGVPSRVIHIRKLPTDISEAEVISLGLPFGDVTNLLMLKAKNQAFLEMNSEEAAQNMVGYYSTLVPIIRHHPVYIQFSNHKELKTDNSPNQEAALRALTSSHVDGVVVAPSSPCLRVVVENLIYPVTLDALCQIVSKFGTVLRIIVFTKNSQFQALLQYAEGASAQSAKLSLDGQNIYNGCCTLRIRLLQTHQPQHRTFQAGTASPPWKHPGMTAFPPGIISAGPYGGAAHGFPPAFTLQPTMSSHYPGLVPGMPGGLAALSLPGASRLGSLTSLQESLSCGQQPEPRGVYGDVMRVKILFNKKENALVQMSDCTQAQLAMSHLSGQQLHGKPLRITPSKHTSVQLPREGHEDQGLTKDYSNSPLHRFKKPGSKTTPTSSRLLPPSISPTSRKSAHCRPSVVEDDLKMLFSTSGAMVKAFKFF